MEELTIEQMTALKGGQETANAIFTTLGNTATASAAAVNNVTSNIGGSISQSADADARARAGNIYAHVTQSV
jgi:hypothetical protein